MPALPSIDLRPDVFTALQGLAKQNHAPSLEAFVEDVLLQVLEDAKQDQQFLSMAQERQKDHQPRLSHDQVWGHLT
ncbi:MAG: hypothetical protein ACKO57_00605 [Alphaproteobacteria bacterium]